ncbi:MAG: CCDC90 family protein [Helicobacteraceae bacterium]|jgi:hypothetical protein|nr:CCDC90 family protein [Helicobacteraceae bacterium]
MSVIMAFDTLATVERLQAAGFQESQAKGVSAVLKEALGVASEGLATKQDLKAEIAALDTKLSLEIAELKGDNKAIRAELGAIKWLVGSVLLGTLAIIVKLFL